MAKSLEQLSLLQRHFYFLWAKTGFDPKERKGCMESAGYSKKTPVNVVERQIRPIVIKAMLRQGIHPDLLARKHKEKLDCKHPAYPAMPDNNAQLKALQMAYDLYDAFPEKKLKIEGKNEVDININIETLRMAEEISGEKIIDLLPEEAFVEEEKEDFLEKHDRDDNGGSE